MLQVQKHFLIEQKKHRNCAWKQTIRQDEGAHTDTHLWSSAKIATKDPVQILRLIKRLHSKVIYNPHQADTSTAEAEH